MRDVRLITGPPCSGKSHLVDQHRRPGDWVVDHDQAAQLLGSSRTHNHGDAWRARAEAYVQQQLHQVASLVDTQGHTVWVVRTVPEGHERDALARWLGTAAVVLLPPESLLLARAGARPAPAATRHAIRAWASRYTPHPNDLVITSSDDYAP
ncbi:AAA family ATPase [Nocardiopsis dassonvillei]|uniref:AAA family ATPase n=1 Tax=Nocardiopsis dassonvillei TaxID=2014 RepID=UPI003640CBDC